MRQRQRVLVGIFVDPLVVVLFAESVRTIAETDGSQQAELLD